MTVGERREVHLPSSLAYFWGIQAHAIRLLSKPRCLYDKLGFFSCRMMSLFHDPPRCIHFYTHAQRTQHSPTCEQEASSSTSTPRAPAHTS